MIWNEAKILSTAEATEAINYMLLELGAKGVSILDPEEVHLINDHPEWHSAPDFVGFEEKFMDQLGDDVVIKAYFSDFSDINLLQKEIETRILAISEFLEIGKGTVEITGIDEENWANSWKKYYKPLKISERIVVKPSWEEYTPQTGEVIIELDPGMAFGTGTHETTSMCLKLIDEYMFAGANVIDVGCGTGILGIAAAKLGASKVSAFDIDENSVRIAKENAEINSVSDIVKVKENDLLKGITGEYDIIIANIIADIVIKMLDSAHKLINSEGFLIVSGIIHDRSEDVKNGLTDAGFELIKSVVDGEWAAFVARKKHG